MDEDDWMTKNTRNEIDAKKWIDIKMANARIGVAHQVVYKWILKKGEEKKKTWKKLNWIMAFARTVFVLVSFHYLSC